MLPIRSVFSTVVRPRLARFTVAIAVQLAVACSARAAAGTPPPAGSAIGPLPAMFVGELPCTDCKGIRYQVELRPDGRFASSLWFKRSGDSQGVEVGAGIWWLSEDSTRLTLDGGVMPDGEDIREVWQVVDRRTLRALDVGWQSHIVGGTGDLGRADSLASIWNERHFLFQAPLADTRWVPRRIGGKPVKLSDAKREPWILLDSKTRKVTGSGGCNRFTGDYDKGVQTLRIHSLATTRMACPELRSEGAFLKVLSETWGYRVTGRRLELLGESGAVLAEFEERNR